MLSDSIDAQFSDNLQKLLIDESHKIILTVPLESCHLNRSRHLVIVSASASQGKVDDRGWGISFCNPYNL